MKITPSNPSDAAELRRRAEARLSEKQKGQRSQAGAQRMTPDTLRLAQELQIHQIELEMQNEQLEQARVETEAALERYTDLYDFAPSGYFTLDRDGTIRQANLTGSELLGVNRARLVNRRFLLFVAENSRPGFRAFAEKVFASRSQETCEAILLREGKSSFYARIEGRISENGQDCRVVVVDITGHKRVEAILYMQAQLLDLAHDAIIVTDQNDTITYWNLGAKQRYGWTREEALGKHMPAFLKTTFPRPLEEIKTILLKEGYWEGELKHSTRDGSRIIVGSRWSLQRDEHGNPAGFLEVNNDITERVGIEERLHRSEERLAGIIESAMDGIITVDERQCIMVLNAAAEKMFGYSASEMLGQSLERLIPERFRAAHPGHIRKYGRTHATRRMIGALGTISGLRASGEEFPIEASISQTTAGGAKLFTVILRDVTEQKRAEQLRLENLRLEERSRQVEAANRLKSEFLANMSHELRTPLNGIIGFTQMLIDKRPGPLNPKQAEYLDDVYNSATHLLQLINDVLDLAKVEAGKMELDLETFAPEKAVGEVCAILQGIANEKGVKLTWDVAPELGRVTLDPHKFKQICYNLLSNAVKFTNPDGNVEIRAFRREEDWFELKVMDSGIGIKPEDLSRLFRPFEQLESGASRRHEGTGLGLALTRKIVELHGGRIGVESEVGHGSRFTVVLPLVAEER